MAAGVITLKLLAEVQPGCWNKYKNKSIEEECKILEKKTPPMLCNEMAMLSETNKIV